MRQVLKYYVIMLAIIGLAGNFHPAFAAPSSYYQEIDLYLLKNEFQGSLLIAKEENVLYSKGYGFANEEYKIPNTTKTIFRLGSITKQFTAVAILQLQEQGLVHVQDPISKYLPDYPQGDVITIHHLLSHSSGIPSITELPNIQEIQRHPSNPTIVMSYFKNLPLDFPPGTNCYYSDSGYIILGAIIEAITRRPYEEYLQENLFNPLEMTSTYYDHNYSIIPNRATGYERDTNGKLIHAAYIDMSVPHAAGSLSSSVDDLYKWTRALQGTQILSKKSLDALFIIHGSSKKNKISYGYGFFIGTDNEELENAKETIIGHYGTIEGFRAASYRYTDDGLTIILLSNVENTDINSLHIGIAQIVRNSWRP